MPESDVTRINAAVGECISRCYFSENPLTAIGEYFAELRAQGDWTEAELTVVRATVARLSLQTSFAADEQITGVTGRNLSWGPQVKLRGQAAITQHGAN